MLAGLMYHKPDDPISFMEDCLAKARNCTDGVYDWKLFHGEGISNAPDLMSQTSNGTIQDASGENEPTSSSQPETEEQTSNGRSEDTSGENEPTTSPQTQPETDEQIISNGSIQDVSAENEPAALSQPHTDEQTSNVEDTSENKLTTSSQPETEEQTMDDILKKPTLFVLGESSCELSLT